MTDQPPRSPRSSPAPRPVAAPNVLSNQAIPNQLSTMGKAGGAAPAAGGPRPALSTAQPAAAGRRANAPAGAGTDERFERQPKRSARGVLIFAAFVVVAVLRLAGNLDLGGSAGPASTPRPSTALRTPAPARTIGAPGRIVFGESATSDGCDLEHMANRFTLAIDVWWQAEMVRVINATESVVYIAKRDGVEVDRDTIPPDSNVGEWSILCGGRPVPGYQPGTYRVEIWSSDRSDLLASGEYTKFESRAPGSFVLPTKRPSPSP